MNKNVTCALLLAGLVALHPGCNATLAVSSFAYENPTPLTIENEVLVSMPLRIGN